MLFQREACRLLAEDPELGAAIPADEQAVANRLAETRLIALPTGTWHPPRDHARGDLGFLILDGVIARRVSGSSRASCELLGDGDLVRPWSRAHGVPPDDERVTWTVIAEAELAVLDARFAERMRRWPQVTEVLLERSLVRADALANQLAILSAHPVERRLVLLLWHLAERWGRVCPEGVRLPLSLTHGLLAEMIGVRRPSLSTAVGQLVDDGRLARPEGRRGWLLVGRPPADEGGIAELTSEAVG